MKIGVCQLARHHDYSLLLRTSHLLMSQQQHRSICMATTVQTSSNPQYMVLWYIIQSHSGNCNPGYIQCSRAKKKLYYLLDKYIKCCLENSMLNCYDFPRYKYLFNYLLSTVNHMQKQGEPDCYKVV